MLIFSLELYSLYSFIFIANSNNIIPKPIIKLPKLQLSSAVIKRTIVLYFGKAINSYNDNFSKPVTYFTNPTTPNKFISKLDITEYRN